MERVAIIFSTITGNAFKLASAVSEVIEWPEEIDGERASAALHRAEERLHSRTPETDIARAETALQRAMARIQVLK